MVTQLTRPNFFPGQMIDYRDFNRLSEQAERVMTFLCSHLFEGGGIVVSAMDEFRIEPTKNLGVIVKPGVAFLPNGQPLVLLKDLALDLSEYKSKSSEKTIHVSLKSVTRGTDKYRDPADPSIEGFLSQTYEPELHVSTKGACEEGIELFRITLSKQSTGLRLPSLEEEWDGYEIGEKDTVSVVDLRHRNYIVPQTYRPTHAGGILELRKALYQIERIHRKIQKIFLVDDVYRSESYLTQLHAELLALPFQAVKVAFLISEVSDKLSLFLESVEQRVGKDKDNFNYDLHLKIMRLLDSTKIKRATPREIPLQAMADLSSHLQEFVTFAEERFNLLNTVEESLVDHRDRHLPYDTTLTLAGHVFERVDHIDTQQTARWRTSSDAPHVRNVHAKYLNGDALSLKGAFIKGGSFSVDLQIPSPDRPVVVLVRQYVRRAEAVLRYQINGKHLVTDQWESLDLSNNWMNRGFVVPPEALVPSGNRLELLIDRTDLDFGFFEVSAYQPTIFKGDYE